MRKLSVFVAAAAVALGAATSASAALTVDAGCHTTDISPTASACAGWFDGNLNQGNPTADTAAALNQLLGVTTFNAGNITVLKDLTSLSGGTIDFGVPLYGETVLSIHVGKAKGAPNSVGFDSTAFFVFDAGEVLGGLQSIVFNRAGLSNAELYSTGTYQPPGGGVPEPATWAMLLLGVGMIGFVARRRNQAMAAVAA